MFINFEVCTDEIFSSLEARTMPHNYNTTGSKFVTQRPSAHLTLNSLQGKTSLESFVLPERACSPVLAPREEAGRVKKVKREGRG